MEFTDEQIAEVMAGLGLTREDIQGAQRSVRARNALYSRVKKSYRRLASTLHPDKTGGDIEKSKLFQLATEVVKEIEAIHPVALRRVKWAVRIKAVIVSG